jgi:hypothetical protein
MTALDPAAVFAGCRERLKDLLGDDVDIAVVEGAIAAYPLDDEEKAALWLWALAPFDPATLGALEPRGDI